MPRYKWKNKDTFPTLTDTNIPHLNDGGSGSGDGDTGLSLMSTGDEDSPKYRSLVSDADPLTASKKESGNWIDIDGDNIPYAIERNPGRVHEDRFDGIPWIESMRRFEREFNDTDDEDKQRIYDKTFNPYVRYQGTPIVDDLKVEGTYDPSPYVGTGADVTIKVYDPAGIEQIYLSSEQESKTVDIDPSDVNNDGVIKKKVHLNTDTWDWVSGWDLDIKVADEAGNMFKKTRGINGVLDSIYDSLSKVANYVGEFADWIWDKVTNAASNAADAAAELASQFVQKMKNQVSNMFSSVVNPIVDGLESWANTIQSKMDNFFTELSNWDDGDGDVDATMNAGTELMMSFVGQQDKAKQVTDVLQRVMSFIKPFQKYLSPFGAIGVVSTAVSEIAGIEDTPISEAKDFFQKDLASKGLSGLLNLLLDDGGLLDKIGFDDMNPDVDFPSISKDAMVNFLSAFSDKIGGSMIIDTIIDAVKNVNIGEGLYWVFSGLMFALTFIGFMTVTSVPGIVLETASLLSGIASAIIGNVGIVIASIATTWGSGFYGLVMSKQPIDKITQIQMVNYWEMVLSPFMICGVVV